MAQHHFTTTEGWKSIRSAPIWRFRASQPPSEHPFGAYFTTLPPGTKKLAARLRIPKEKTRLFFEFSDLGDLVPLRGGRGEYIWYSKEDYPVAADRQVDEGESLESARRRG